MVGLLQTIILMGCIYMVLKVFHIFQTGLSAPPESRGIAKTFSLIALVIGFGGAGFCFYLMMDQAAHISGPY